MVKERHHLWVDRIRERKSTNTHNRLSPISPWDSENQQCKLAIGPSFGKSYLRLEATLEANRVSKSSIRSWSLRERRIRIRFPWIALAIESHSFLVVTIFKFLTANILIDVCELFLTKIIRFYNSFSLLLY